jgi:2-phospho-L-lactate/phosphoenolpyruvate guanylyltransferase
MLWRRIVSVHIVIPVRGGAAAKSRLGGDPEWRERLARAIALDTIEAALEVAPVIVVTDEKFRMDAESLGARTVPDPGHGLNPAIAAGLAAASTPRTAVLLGDLPALDPRELREALAEAAAHDRAMVSDADGAGTVLLVAAHHDLAFGANSRALHIQNGYTELDGTWPTLRRDIDLPEHLLALTRGRRTLELLSER